MPSKKSVTKTIAPKTKRAARRGSKTVSAPLVKSGPSKAQRVASRATKSTLAKAAKTARTAPAKTKPLAITKPGVALATFSEPSWPQAASAGGSVVAHAVRATGSHASVAPAAFTRDTAAATKADRRTRLADAAPAAAWLSPWNTLGEQAARAMRAAPIGAGLAGAGPLKGAFDQQLQLFQTLARLSPLTLAVKGTLQGQSMLMSMLTSFAGKPARTTRER